LLSWDELRSVESAVSERECLALYTAATIASKVGPIVEIGTYKGRSALVLGSALKASASSHKLYTVDRFVPFVDDSALKEGAHQPEEVRPSSKQEVEQLVAKHGLDRHIIVCECSSHEAANKFQYVSSYYVSMLFIDGSHDEASVMLDYTSWRYVLDKNAIIAWHDYYDLGARGGRFDGVHRTVEKLLSKGEIRRLDIPGLSGPRVDSLLLTERVG
jgi:hypothetical protein